MKGTDFGARGYGPAPKGSRGPLHRCFYCDALVLPDTACRECGSRKTRIAWQITDKEMFDAVGLGYEPDPAAFEYHPDNEMHDMLRAGLRPGIKDD